MSGGRPIKKGLDYFHLDTSIGDKVKYLKKICKMDGYGIFVSILERIYKFEGYYCKWDEMAQVLFCDNGMELNRLKEVVDCCLKVELFNRDIYDKYKILTSAEIQTRYMFIIHLCKRKGISIMPNLSLIQVSSEDTGVSSEETIISSEETKMSDEESKKKTQKRTFDEHAKKEFTRNTSEETGGLLRRNYTNGVVSSQETAVNSEETPVYSESNTQRKGKERKGKEKKEKKKIIENLRNSETEFTLQENSVSLNLSFVQQIKNEKMGKIKKSEKKEKNPDKLFNPFKNIYSDWFKKQNGIEPKIDGADYKALKLILNYFRKITNNPQPKEEIINPMDSETLGAWEYIFVNYKKWDNFYQKQLNLRHINSNLINIINSIQNGKQQPTLATSINDQYNKIINDPSWRDTESPDGVKHLPSK